jgi:hypothetical protein
MQKRWSFGLVSMVVGVGIAATLAAPGALACGGFFCDGGGINQASERIVFVDDGAGNVTAVVQIQYAGPANSFSWVLPVAGVPTIGVSSNVAFTRLQQATNPQYNLLREFNGNCPNDFFPPSASDGDAAEGEGESGGVQVLGSGSVGPYNYDIIQVPSEEMNKAAVAIQWLQDNGYDQPAETADVLGPYLNDGLNLVAFRLQSTADVGEIRPVVLVYQTPHPMIPIRPTAVAANNDMGVMTWLVAPARAIPTNYRHLILNEAAINWLSPSSNYNDVISQAADEANGQGFVTEDARESTGLADAVHPIFERDAWTNFQAIADDFMLVQQTYWSFGAFDGARDVYRDLAAPVGIDFDQWYSCIDCTNWSLPADFDRAAFIAAIDGNVMAPLRDMADLLRSQPMVTRLYTTMSADEMNLDPEFDYNPTLPMVSNVHTATQTFNCEPDNNGQQTWDVALENGLVIAGFGFTWPLSLIDVPAAEQIRLENTTGEGVVTVDVRDSIRARVNINNRDRAAEGQVLNDRRNAPSLRGGCNCGGGSAAMALWPLLLMLRRRRS